MRLLSLAALLGASLIATTASAQTAAPPAGRLLAIPHGPFGDTDPVGFELP